MGVLYGAKGVKVVEHSGDGLFKGALGWSGYCLR